MNCKNDTTMALRLIEMVLPEKEGAELRGLHEPELHEPGWRDDVSGAGLAIWREKDRAVKSTRIAIELWAFLLLAWVGMILWLQKP